MTLPASPPPKFSAAARAFADSLRETFASGMPAQPEDQLEGPVQALLATVTRGVLTKTEAQVDDPGRWPDICVQGKGSINGQPLNSPKLIRFTELTEDEFFCTEDGAKAGVTYENTSETEPLVVLLYFGLDVNPDAPAMGAYRRNNI